MLALLQNATQFRKYNKGILQSLQSAVDNSLIFTRYKTQVYIGKSFYKKDFLAEANNRRGNILIKITSLVKKWHLYLFTEKGNSTGQ